ncbi:hypothetical protein [Flagellimonas lutaonensis]|uniref:Uncharacterized protein n=1 Tax=Flagellimonas lutaonensis TaxID=516051 RepID=A0A0D5YRL9_9FLAO|nr:hypothetical protein [Allomuricauda lutaonensis]AKA34513.1 hypothetical protein VC82_859 [Allomuricauda lutaonensis]
MKTLKVIGIAILLLGFGMGTVRSQITQPKVKPKVNLPVKLPTAFDKIMYDLDHGTCYEIAVVSLQLNARNQQRTSFGKEARYGLGSLFKSGNELKSVLPLEIGIKQTPHQRTVQTTVRLKKNGKTVTLDIRNSQYYHLIYDVKIIKKKNGYWLMAEKDHNNETVSFIFAIYKTDCLI